jgi:WD40 repeat protein
LTVALGLTAWNQRNQAIAAGNIRATAEVEAIFESNTRATAEADAIAVGYQRATAQVDAEDKRQEASAQRELAISRQLSAQSTVHLEPDQLDLSLLFAVQAARIEDTFEARSSLLNGLRYRPHLQRILYGDASGSLGFGNGLAFSADGEMIASGNDNGTITLWEVSTGRQVGDPLVGHEKWVSSLAFSPDGSLLASGSHDETVILWDVATRQPLDQPLTGLPRLVFDLAFSANGDLLAVSCGQDIFLLEVASRDLVYGFHMLGGTTRSVAFSPDGKILAATDYKSLTAGGSVVLWNLETGEKLAEVNKAHISGGFAVAFHPNGNSLATGGDGRHIFDYGEVRFWDSLTLQPLDNKLVKLPGHVRDIAFLPGGEQLVFNLEDKIWLWELDADLPVVQSFPAYVKDMVLSPAGDLLATIGPNATVYVWDLVDRQSNIQHPIEASEQVASVAYHPEGIILASGGCGQRAEEGGPCTRGRIRFWDTQTEAPANQPFEGHAGEVTSLAFHPDGASFASGGEDGTIILWAELTGEWVSQLIRGHEGEITQVAFSPNGGILASSSSDGEVALWDAATGEPIGEPLIRHSDPITSLVFSPDGGILASGSEAGTILFWDITNGDQILELMTGEPVSSLAFSPDGARLASGGEGGAISVWDTAKGTLVDQPLSVHKEAVIGIVFRPGMDMLASASADGEVIFWDAASHHVIGGPLVGDSRALRTLAISPNGYRLASGGEDGITLWDISLEAWQEHACQIANRNLTSEEWEATLGELPYQKTCPNLP